MDFKRFAYKKSVIPPILFLLLLSLALVSSQINRQQLISSKAAVSGQSADINGDGTVGLLDYTILFENFGMQPLINPAADLNSDGLVNILDYGILFASWGQTNPTATASPQPFNAPSPTSTQTTMIEGVPVCTDHDNTRWHALVKRNPDNSINCTYGHEHHDDPNSVNDIFGPPGAWYEAGGSYSGQSISYPWQTFAFTTDTSVNLQMPPPPTNPSLMENNAKHNGYKWVVRRDVPCIPFNLPPNDGCYRAMRAQFHTLGTTADTVVRFHSFSVELLVEYKGKQGIFRKGGWMDAGFLGLLVDGGDFLICPPLITNPPGFKCPATGTAGGHRDAYSTNTAPRTPHANPGGKVNWYTANSHAQPHVEDFGPIDFTNPSLQLFYPEQYRANNSIGGHENVSVSIDGPIFTPYIGADGRVNFNGFVNRHGAIVTGCTKTSLDCVPMIVEGALPALYSAHPATSTTAFYDTEHDVLSPVTGKSLISYPN